MQVLGTKSQITTKVLRYYIFEDCTFVSDPNEWSKRSWPVQDPSKSKQISLNAKQFIW